VPPAALAADVISRPRRRGNAKLRRILVGAVDPADVRSVLELRFLRLCAAYGIPRPEVNVRNPAHLGGRHGALIRHRREGNRRHECHLMLLWEHEVTLVAQASE
jgi:hypothetical protein